jgi:hypothetical protein
MAKSYLISLSQSDLEAIIFRCIDQAIKLNNLGANVLNPEKEKSPAQKNKPSDKRIKKEAING